MVSQSFNPMGNRSWIFWVVLYHLLPTVCAQESSMISNPKLRECPRCSSNHARMVEVMLYLTKFIMFGRAYKVVCQDCNLAAPSSNDKDNAVEKWNYRPDEHKF